MSEQDPQYKKTTVWLLTPLASEDGSVDPAHHNISGGATWLVVILLTCAGLGALTVLGVLLWLVWRAVTA